MIDGDEERGGSWRGREGVVGVGTAGLPHETDRTAARARGDAWSLEARVDIGGETSPRLVVQRRWAPSGCDVETAVGARDNV